MVFGSRRDAPSIGKPFISAETGCLPNRIDGGPRHLSDSHPVQDVKRPKVEPPWRTSTGTESEESVTVC